MLAGVMYALIAVSFAQTYPRCCIVAAKDFVMIQGAYLCFCVFSGNQFLPRVESRGFEPLTSAVQRQCNRFTERALGALSSSSLFTKNQEYSKWAMPYRTSDVCHMKSNARCGNAG